uniref:Uncharacterized protein n=1 Tax=Solibacter usitatus (strain Ellin6076) TaxID=234267 RepID=Q01P73_SOLUE
MGGHPPGSGSPRLQVRGWTASRERLSGDGVAVDLVLNDLSQSFVRELGDSDLETLTAELARIAFDGDALALEAAEREVLASLDADSRSGAGHLLGCIDKSAFAVPGNIALRAATFCEGRTCPTPICPSSRLLRSGSG